MGKISRDSGKTLNKVTRLRRSFKVNFADPYWESPNQKLVKILKKL